MDSSVGVDACVRVCGWGKRTGYWRAPIVFGCLTRFTWRLSRNTKHRRSRRHVTPAPLYLWKLCGKLCGDIVKNSELLSILVGQTAERYCVRREVRVTERTLHLASPSPSTPHCLEKRPSLTCSNGTEIRAVAAARPGGCRQDASQDDRRGEMKRQRRVSAQMCEWKE
ncbi:uncharacterized protein LOC123498793 [Portunus trituberculatus]|uniref:uncharacterized protein LOC123498793 n=1 Tax=Portunus trituberculatus TaxID=210409 RepID=UPI001E1CD5CA|nr:uncharacterized protein LOC123498793 [Portunus trituberculatus]